MSTSASRSCQNLDDDDQRKNWRDGDRHQLWRERPLSYTAIRGGGRGRRVSLGRGQGRAGIQTSSVYRREASSSHSLDITSGSATGRPDGYSRRSGSVAVVSKGVSRGSRRRRQRTYPISSQKMEQLLCDPADSVPLVLLSELSGFSRLLEQDVIHDDLLELIIKVLAHSTASQSNRECLYELINKTFNAKFIQKLCMHTSKVKRIYHDRAENVFENLLTVSTIYVNSVTMVAIELLPVLIDLSISALQELGTKYVSLMKQYEALQLKVTEEVKRFSQRKSDSPRKVKLIAQDLMEPPEDYRQISVLPTTHELAFNERPFLRRNITDGRYRDAEHYLDIQFRLLREDFVRPLRNGIDDLKNDANSRISDIYVYRNVAILGTKLLKHKMFHEVKLDLPKTFKIEHSKRFIFGNLLCFSCDNFKNIVFGSVAEADPNMLANGIIGVEFDSAVGTFDLSANYVMIESKAFFKAYKHVLEALQTLDENTLPLEPYIVHMEENIKLPSYMRGDESYDLRVIKSPSMMKQREATNFLNKMSTKNKRQPPAQVSGAHYLQNVTIASDLELWPSEIQMDLDSSQRRALRSALTREVAIIQGPPGTGKTFIGLKIVQILLHNSDIWKPKNNPTPVLVICFTNHALDQFLEGMTVFTDNIVRVGSRTKSETIDQFQINKLMTSLIKSRGFPATTAQTNYKLNNEVEQLRRQVTKFRQIAEACEQLHEIVSLEFFESENIIPHRLHHQIISTKESKPMRHWLFFDFDWKDMPRLNTVSSQTAGKNVVNRVALHDATDENCEHRSTEGQDFVRMKEKDRLLEEDDSDGDSFEEEIINPFESSTNEIERELTEPEMILEFMEFPENPHIARLENHKALNVWHLEHRARWQLYRHWTKKLKEIAAQKLHGFEIQFQKKTSLLREVRDQQYLYIMRQASIVGMTTTGAAQHNRLLQDLGPAIVVIEEAAEILEAHVIAALSAKCRHLVMIGDHQQLRPSATVYELATRYGLQTSLFERMVKNGLAYETLEYQHRMRPSISQLLVPSVYSTLKDHTSVHGYPSIKGMTKDVFFVTHEEDEKLDTDDNYSHENQHEAELIMGLCRHLVLQGYSQEDITILTAYSGQFFLLCKIQKQDSICSGVKICVVDNFQGEENKIILLSLVRSNPEGVVGFLSTENRVCVALSRAKHALYITGNMALLSAKSKLWKSVQEDLFNIDSIGASLTLQCQNHPDQLMNVSSGEDFRMKSPNGGCQLICGQALPKCLHACPQLCHIYDPEHIEYRCTEPCPKILCDLNHRCPKLCGDVCGPCEVRVSKTLPCGHMHSIPCHVTPEDYKCPTRVEKTMPLCEHIVEMPCYTDPKKSICTFDCDTRLDCGHKCQLNCHRGNDPDHTEYKCQQQCTKLNANCIMAHPCTKKCYEPCGECQEPVDKMLPCRHQAKGVPCALPLTEVTCKEKCKKTLPCGHACKKMCRLDCGTCQTKVKKVVPECNHSIVTACGEPPSQDQCEGQCTRALPCGHPCREQCKDPCTPTCTTLTLAPGYTSCPRGHRPIRLPCHLIDQITEEGAWAFCEEACGETLDCGHTCGGRCGRCLHGRLHDACLRPCHKPLPCGHACKQPCSTKCPPCTEKCPRRCSHGRCSNKCGSPCVMCKENCRWKCKHHKCTRYCGDICSRDPCTEPCKNKLECGHECVGFCGEVCPPLCRHCHKQQLSECTLMGLEGTDDTRYVLLEDCGHTIEAVGFEQWLMNNEETCMKTCPRCRTVIYNNQRYKNIILKTYEAARAARRKNYFQPQQLVTREDIEHILQDPDIVKYFSLHSNKLMVRLFSFGQKKEKTYNDEELKFIKFQAEVIRKASQILSSVNDNESSNTEQEVEKDASSQELQCEVRLTPLLSAVVERVIEKTTTMAPQFVQEVSCELQRLMILPAYWKLQQKTQAKQNNLQVMLMKAKLVKIQPLMHATVKFEEDHEQKVVTYLKESEKYAGDLGICGGDRLLSQHATEVRRLV